MNKQDVIQAAAQLEKDGQTFYLGVAAKATNPMVKEVFEQLAEDEVKHLSWIDNNLGPHDPEGQPAPAIYDRLKPLFAEVSPELRSQALASQDDIEPLRVALKFEGKAVDRFSSWAAEVEDSDAKIACEKLAAEEQLHVRILENTILYLENPEAYFQQEEGWMMDGA